MKIIASLFGAASLLALAGGANAGEIQPQPLGLTTSTIEATTVAFGCGPGFFPNRFGVCRPRFFRGYGYGYGRPYGYGYGYGRGYYGGGYGYRRYGFY